MARKQGSHSDITGPKVREAALRLIARDGFAATSMRQIAGEVGVQAGALYNYVSDKQSLLFELMEAHMTEVLAALEAEAITGSPAERLEAFTRFHVRFHLPRRDAIFVNYMELRNLTPENFARIGAMRRTYEAALEAILRDGVAEGTFRIGDLRVTTFAMIALLTGLTNWYDPGGRLSVAEVEDIYVDLMLNAAGAVANG